MKKRLFCIGLLFAMVFAFAFSACDNNYTPPDYGEQGYVEHYVIGFELKGNHPKGTLITSMKELKQYREAVKPPEHWLEGSNNPNKDPYADALAPYSARYFKDNMLIAFMQGTESGMYWLDVKGVEAQDGTITVTIRQWKPYTGGTVRDDSVQYGFLIEYPKGDYSELKVVKESISQKRGEVKGTALDVMFTHEASLATIDHDYTPEDFPELDFDFTIEEYATWSRDRVREMLSNGSASDFFFESYCRKLKITLAETSKENVLRAIELLQAREEIEKIDPAYEYYWPQN